jgi:hypothetical protein
MLCADNVSNMLLILHLLYIQVLSGYIRLYHCIQLSGRFLLPLASFTDFLYIFKRND